MILQTFTVTSSIGYVAYMYCSFSTFKRAAVRPSSWNFWNWHVLRYHVKFCGDRSNCCRDITFFRVFQVKFKISLCHALWNNLAKARYNWINFCIDINTIWACKILFRWGNIAKKNLVDTFLPHRIDADWWHTAHLDTDDTAHYWWKCKQKCWVVRSWNFAD